MRRLFAPFILIFTHRMLLRQTVRQEYNKRYSGSLLGLGWLVLHPLLFLGIYALVYVYIFNVRFQLFTSSEYVLLIFCGLIPFLAFADSLSSGVGSVVSNASLIKNTLFPIELVPLKILLSCQAGQVVGLGLLLIVTAYVKGLNEWALMIPVIWGLQLMFMAGLLWILSSLNVFVRDLQYIIGTIILMLMMISPIAYTPDMLDPTLAKMLNFNPLAHFIFCYQDVVFFGRAPTALHMQVITIVSLVTFMLGYFMFGRLKRVMIDHV